MSWANDADSIDSLSLVDWLERIALLHPEIAFWVIVVVIVGITVALLASILLGGVEIEVAQSHILLKIEDRLHARTKTAVDSMDHEVSKGRSSGHRPKKRQRNKS